jgi:translation elongation factor EF-1alpha
VSICLVVLTAVVWCSVPSCALQVFTVEMHHKRVEKAGPGDNVGMNIKGLDKGNMPRTGDVMILKSDQTLKPVKDFTAQVRTTCAADQHSRLVGWFGGSKLHG